MHQHLAKQPQESKSTRNHPNILQILGQSLDNFKLPPPHWLQLQFYVSTELSLGHCHKKSG